MIPVPAVTLLSAKRIWVAPIISVVSASDAANQFVTGTYDAAHNFYGLHS